MHKILLLAWLLTLGTSLLIDAKLLDQISSWKLSLRLASSVILVLTGFLSIGTVPPRFRIIAILVALGMLLGFLGDSTMASVLGKDWFPNRLLGGMIFFGIGHLFYIAATEVTRRKLSLPANSKWWLAILAWQIIGVVIWYFVVGVSTKDTALHYPALGYVALLAGTAGIMTGLALLDRRFIWVALGAILFLASDALLAWEHFRGGSSLVGFLVWATYGPGQMLIVFGFARVLCTPFVPSKEGK